jgi:hypothetical protein
MIKLLAEFFRQIHFVAGISLPPPTTSERAFVGVWLATIAGIAAFCVVLFVYIIPFLFLHLSH